MKKVTFIVFFVILSLSLLNTDIYAQGKLKEWIRERIKKRWQTQTNSPYGSGDYDFSIKHDGVMRKYYVHVPVSYNGSTSVPLVLNFHGGFGNAESAKETSLMDVTSDKKGFIAVYPEAVGIEWQGKKMGGWNACDDCGAQRMVQNTNDDVGFISKMIDKLIEDFNVDPERIYATGHSNGAQMTYRLACELPDKIAAIAPIGMQVLDKQTCKERLSGRTMPIILFHGTRDNCSLYEGGECGGCFATFLNTYLQHPKVKPYFPDFKPIDVAQFQFACESIPSHIEWWKDINQVSDSPVTYQNGDATCITYGWGKDGETVLCTIEGMGHTWPGGIQGSPCKIQNSLKCQKWEEVMGALSADVNANELMWEFFRRHPKK